MSPTWARTVVWRAGRGFLDDDVATVAGGVAFFVLLAVFPGLAALISLVGIFADPGRIDALLAALSEILPDGAAQVLTRQIDRLARLAVPVEQHRGLALAPYLGFAVLVWSANKGTKALFRALNTIHGREEERGFLILTAVTLLFTLGALGFLAFALGLILGLPPLLGALGLAGTLAGVLDLLRWPFLFIVVGGVIAVIYRFGPTRRRRTGWRPIALGSLAAATLWIGGSLLFSWFVARFGGLDEIYGSLSAVIGFMVWIWFSAIAVLAGAELDAAAERTGGGASA